jgi:hypothetical protein
MKSERITGFALIALGFAALLFFTGGLFTLAWSSSVLTVIHTGGDAAYAEHPTAFWLIA